MTRGGRSRRGARRAEGWGRSAAGRAARGVCPRRRGASRLGTRAGTCLALLAVDSGASSATAGDFRIKHDTTLHDACLEQTTCCPPADTPRRARPRAYAPRAVRAPQQARARRAREPARARLRFTPRPSVPPRRARVCTFVRTAARRQGSASPGFGRAEGVQHASRPARRDARPHARVPRVRADHQGEAPRPVQATRRQVLPRRGGARPEGCVGGHRVRGGRRRGARGVPAAHREGLGVRAGRPDARRGGRGADVPPAAPREGPLAESVQGDSARRRRRAPGRGVRGCRSARGEQAARAAVPPDAQVRGQLAALPVPRARPAAGRRGKRP